MRRSNIINFCKKEQCKNPINEKIATNEEGNRDRLDKDKTVICFDLQNVLSCL